MLNRIKYYALFVLAVVMLSSCRNGSASLVLPAISPFNNSSSWAVVRVPYLRLAPEITRWGDVNAILRLGEVVAVEEIRSIAQSGGYWRDYFFISTTDSDNRREGWVTAESLALFDHREAALRNSREIQP